MMKRSKTMLKVNIVSLFLIAVSLTSITYAWFSSSGISRASMTVDINAWYIELEKEGEIISNDVVISLSEIYPGMETITELVKVRNKGDSIAEVDYSIISTRILDNIADSYLIDEDNVTTNYVSDILAHKYPFSINIGLSRNYILAKGDEVEFEVSIAWPLDSGTDELDSEWGNKAHIFQTLEAEKKQLDSFYQTLPALQVKLTLMAQQYLDLDTSSDVKYNLGDEILVDVINNAKCSTISPTCIKTYVIDKNNVLSNKTVTLLPNPYKNYDKSDFDNFLTTYNNYVNSWNVITRPIVVDDILKLISTDINKSMSIIDGHSDKIIGSLNNQDRITSELNKLIAKNGYYRFLNSNFNYLNSVTCYWIKTEYNYQNGFALIKDNDITSKLYGNLKTNSCNVIPIIEMKKSNLI